MSKHLALLGLLEKEHVLSPQIKGEGPLKTILDKALAELTVSSPDINVPKILWGPERYGLHKASAFNSLSDESRQRYLQRMTELNLSLSAFIETSGHNYGAKMILLSDTLEEKSTYALFACDEAVHLREFQNFMNFKYDLASHGHPMLEPLTRAIQEGSRATLVFVVQVLLEGFGMGHYHGLKEDCLHPPLQRAYDRILKDEARHHGAGIVLAKEGVLTREDQDQIFFYTREFVKALHSARWLSVTFETIGHSLTGSQLEKLWQDIGFNEVLVQRMKKLKEMLLKVDSFGLVEKLEAEGVFRPHGGQ